MFRSRSNRSLITFNYLELFCISCTTMEIIQTNLESFLLRIENITAAHRNAYMSVHPILDKCAYKLPVIKHDKITIVFVPSSSLLQYHLELLKSQNLIGYGLHSKTSTKDRNWLIKNLFSPDFIIQFLCISPTRSLAYDIKRIIQNFGERSKIDYVIVEEAHRLSESSRCFNPDYLEFTREMLFDYENQLPYIPTIAVTCESSAKVRDDVCEELKLTNPELFSYNIGRFPMYYDVQFMDSIEQPEVHLKNFLTTTLGKDNMTRPRDERRSGIIYCTRQSTIELIVHELNRLGVESIGYHSDLNKKKRDEIRNKWLEKEIPILVTTRSFIGKFPKPLRCVVHWSFPSNMFEYYETCMAAHNKDDMIYCRLYFSFVDYKIQKSLLTLNSKKNSTINKNFAENIKELLKYCLSARCRRKLISECLKLKLPSCKGHCDYCKRSANVRQKIEEFKEMCEVNNEILPPLEDEPMEIITID